MLVPRDPVRTTYPYLRRRYVRNLVCESNDSAHTSFKNSMARRRRLSNDTAEPWGLIPHSLTPFHYLRKGQ
jgi:hypothetical protein